MFLTKINLDSALNLKPKFENFKYVSKNIIYSLYKADFEVVIKNSKYLPCR